MGNVAAPPLWPAPQAGDIMRSMPPPHGTLHVIGPCKLIRTPRSARQTGTLRQLFLAGLAVATSAAAAWPQEWTRFRGPNGSGLAQAPSVPTSWTEKDYRWKVELPGTGISQPVLWGDKIFVLSAADDGTGRFFECRRAKDGSAEWTQKYPLKAHPKHDRNTFATSTPVVDADRVYLILTAPEASSVSALDHSGKTVWTRELGAHVSRHAGGASPILHDDLVIVTNEIDEHSFLAAFDRKSGAERWRTERKSAAAAYGTPCVAVDAGGKAELVFSSNAHGVYGVDPKSGSVRWEAMLFEMRTVSSPVIAGGLVLATCGSGAGGNYVVAVRTGGQGDVTASHLAYKLTRSMPYVPTVLARDGLVFLWSDKGVVTCVEAANGNIVWQERVGGSYSGSPVCIGDRIYCMSEEGDVAVVAASKEYKLLARNSMGEGSRSTPAVAGGRLYLRTYRTLICLGGELGTERSDKVPAGSAGAAGSK